MTTEQTELSSAATVLAISGGSGAGKTTLARKLLHLVGSRGTHMTIDWYYRDCSHLSVDDRSRINFDHPDSLEVDLFVEHLTALRRGAAVEVPIYDFATHTRTDATNSVQPAPIIVTEGIHLLALEPVRVLCDIAVFLDVPASVRLSRRIQRDATERGRSEQSVRAQWEQTVSPMHERFVQPSKSFANVVVASTEDLDDVASRLARQFADT